MYPEDYKYSEEHEWLRVEGDTAVLGVTDYAQAELGEVVFADLQEAGSTFEAGDEIGTVESVKTVAEIYTPVSGEIVEVNSELEGAPEKINDDPHGDGWLVKIRLSKPEEVDDLMDAEAYREFVDQAG